MKKVIRMIALSLALATTIALFSGCGVETEGTKSGVDLPTTDNLAGPIEVMVWNTFSEGQAAAFQKIVDDFNGSQNEVKVIAQAQPFQEFDKKLMQAVRNGTNPDIAIDYPASVANYLPEGVVVNLSQYVDDPDIGIEGFKESVAPGIYAEATQFDETGNLYVLPVHVTGTTLFYNKTLYDELGLSLPRTWEEMAENCRIIRDQKGIYGFGFNKLVDGAQILIMQGGSEYYNREENRVDINCPGAVEAFERFAECVGEDLYKLKSDIEFAAEFGAQDIASYINSVASLPFCEEAVGGAFEIGAAPIPQGKNPWAPAWNRGAILFKSDDATQRAAFSFLKYFVSPSVNAQWCKDFVAISAYPAVNESEIMRALLNENVALRALSEDMSVVGYIPAFNGSGTVRNEIDKAIQECSTGMKTATEALDDAAEICNSELASVNG